ncbi:MAG TPA: hypothetical protein VIS07_01110 [Candidatus Binatia bacterium]
MSFGKLLDEAVGRLEDASLRIEAAKVKPFDQQCSREWLEALTDYCVALNDIQRLNNASIHEKLHRIAGHLKLDDLL